MNVLNKILNALCIPNTPDDKLAKYLISKVNKETVVERGQWMSDGYTFKMDDKKYECCYSLCYVNDLKFKSKYFNKLYDKLMHIHGLKLDREIITRTKMESLKRAIDFKLALETHGGIGKILEKINKINSETQSSYFSGKMYIDGNMFHAYSTTDENNRTHINSITINLKTLDVTMHRSYGAYSDYRKFEGKIKNLIDVQKYLDILNNQSKEEYKNKQEFINAL